MIGYHKFYVNITFRLAPLTPPHRSHWRWSQAHSQPGSVPSYHLQYQMPALFLRSRGWGGGSWVFLYSARRLMNPLVIVVLGAFIVTCKLSATSGLPVRKSLSASFLGANTVNSSSPLSVPRSPALARRPVSFLNPMLLSWYRSPDKRSLCSRESFGGLGLNQIWFFLLGFDIYTTDRL